METRIPRFTLDGVPDCAKSQHPFSTEDGLGLSLTRFHRADCDDVVLLIYGLTSASDVFIMPEHRNLTTFLLDSGFTDVWAADFRMSERFPYNTETHRYTLDDIALFDHPATIAELRRHVGEGIRNYDPSGGVMTTSVPGAKLGPVRRTLVRQTAKPLEFRDFKGCPSPAPCFLVGLLRTIKVIVSGSARLRASPLPINVMAGRARRPLPSSSRRVCAQ